MSGPRPGIPPGDPADEALIDLDQPGQPLTVGPVHGTAELVRPSPRRSVRSQAQNALQAQGRDPVLLSGDEPCGSEPRAQRSARAVVKETLERYIENYNQDVKPFTWTKSAEYLLGKMKRKQTIYTEH